MGKWQVFLINKKIYTQNINYICEDIVTAYM